LLMYWPFTGPPFSPSRDPIRQGIGFGSIVGEGHSPDHRRRLSLVRV
jgi:hypothetical protein